MDLLKKSNLMYTYRWTTIANDNPKVTGTPDTTIFNRNEGYEVIYLLNKLTELWKWENISFCIKLEKMIKEDLPSNIRSQKNVKEWLASNWSVR